MRVTHAIDVMALARRDAQRQARAGLTAAVCILGAGLLIGPCWVTPAGAEGWQPEPAEQLLQSLVEADAGLDLLAAREHALAVVAADPTSAAAVAAASWWSSNLDWLPEPEAILLAAGERPGPSTAVQLARIEAELLRRPPVGSLTTAELAGPFGVFDTLDLERNVVPPDDQLPELGTRWRGAAEPFRLAITSGDGWIGPDGTMLSSGIYLAAWSLRVSQAVEGWMIVEARGGFNLQMDGVEVDRRRYCGAEEAGSEWYRVSLEPGDHRLRIAMASRDDPEVRVSLLDAGGEPLAGVRVLDRVSGPWAQSTVVASLPPAEERLLERLEAGSPEVARVPALAASGDAPVEAASAGQEQGGVLSDPLPDDRDRAVAAFGWLLAAAQARARNDALEERRRLERALGLWPEAPLVHLDLAGLFLQRFTGADAATDARRCDEHLRQAAELPMATLMARALAVAQNRDEDAERLLDQLVDGGIEDPRVLAEWVREAVRRSWVRQAEQALERLQTLAPAAWGVAALRLDVLEQLERWEERNRLLQALAETGPDRLGLVDRLVETCRQDEALAMLERIRAAGDDPVLDLGAVRMLAQLGRYDEAGQQLEAAASRWGELASFDHYRVILAGGDEARLDQALGTAIDREPWNLDLHTLAWRMGAEPFYEPFRDEDAVTEAIAGAYEEHGAGADPRSDTESVDGTGEGTADAAEPGEDGSSDGDVDAILLLDQAVERVFEDGSSIYYYHGLTRVLTPTGARQASTLQHLPGTQRLIVRIVKPDGEVVIPPELGPEADTFEIGDLKAGDLLEEEYVAAMEPTGASRRGHLSPFTYRFADAERAFGLSEYILLVPEGLELSLDGNFEGLEHREWTQDGLTIMRWRAREMPPVLREPFAPPESELLPWITYSFGVSWQDVGDAVRDQVLPVLRGSPELDEWGAEALTGDDPGQRLASLVGALIDEVETGRGQLDLGSRAGASFARQKGNRLAILATVLIDAGWRVDMVLSRPFALAGTHLEVPSADVFMQPLLRVSSEGQTMWVDLEEERQGVDHISPALQRSDGLVLPLSRPLETVTLIDQLPEMENPDLEDRQLLKAALSERGDARIHYEVPLHGAQAERMLEHVRSLPAERMQQAFQQIAAQIFPGAAGCVGSVERSERGAILSLDLDLPRACEVGGDRMTCRSLVVVQPVSPVLASLPERRYPLVLGVPVERVIELELNLPEGWSLDDGPRLFETGWGTVRETLEPTEAGVRSTLRLSMPAEVVAPEDYPVFARFCHAADELMTRPVQARRGGP